MNSFPCDPFALMFLRIGSPFYPPRGGCLMFLLRSAFASDLFISSVFFFGRQGVPLRFSGAVAPSSSLGSTRVVFATSFLWRVFVPYCSQSIQHLCKSPLLCLFIDSSRQNAPALRFFFQAFYVENTFPLWWSSEACLMGFFFFFPFPSLWPLQRTVIKTRVWTTLAPPFNAHLPTLLL